MQLLNSGVPHSLESCSGEFIPDLRLSSANLTVYGQGRYRFADYVRIEIPLSLVVAAVALVVMVLTVSCE